MQSELGKGSCFTWRLPFLQIGSELHATALIAGYLSEAPIRNQKNISSRPGSRFDEQRAGRTGYLVLVAEDNETSRNLFARQLALLGHTADLVANGKDALVRWRAGNYDILLTDVHMPEMDGYQLAQTIRAEEREQSRIPIIGLSANAMAEEIERCLAAGMDEYLVKPILLMQLQQVLEHWTNEPEAQQQTQQKPAPAAPQHMTGEASLHINILKALVGDDWQVVQEFLKDFSVMAKHTHKALRQASDACDFADVVRQAHRFKSSARAVGALRLGTISAGLEQAGRQENPVLLRTSMAAFDHEMTAVVEQMNYLMMNMR